MSYRYNRIILSIIIPMYNAENTIVRLMKSISCCHSDMIEVIVVDDGSLDNSVDILEKYVDSYSVNNVRIIKKKNGGASSSRNVGMENIRANHFIFCDSDDELVPGAIDFLINVIQEDDELLIYQLTTGKKVISQKEILSGCFKKKAFVQNMDLWLSEPGIINSPVTKVYSKAIVYKYGLRFDEKIKTGEDLDFNIRYIDVVKNKIVVLNNVLYVYHTESSRLSKGYIADYSTARWNSIKKMREFYEKYGIDLNMIYYCEIKYVYAVSFMMMHKESDKGKKDIKRFIVNMKKDEEIKKAIKLYRPNSVIDYFLSSVIKSNSVDFIYLMMSTIRRGACLLDKIYERASV